MGNGPLARIASEIGCDIRAARSREPAARGVSTLEILATWPGVHALLAHRVAHALHRAGVPLGGTGFATGKRHPTVQDNVTIGSGAKLLGPIVVGHGSKIGANSVVIHDVPPNSTVVGNPGHPVRVDGRRPEGPDADWVHLPDPIADAIKSLAGRIEALEELAGEAGQRTEGEIRELRRAIAPVRSTGPNPAGG